MTQFLIDNGPLLLVLFGFARALLSLALMAMGINVMALACRWLKAHTKLHKAG